MLTLLAADEILSFDRPWFPGLAERLVGATLATRGLAPLNYTTHGWLGVDVNAAIDARPNDALRPWLTPAPVDLQTSKAALGLRFAGSPQAFGEALVRDAWACLGGVPDVERSVTALVLSIHPLQAAGAGYDVSHSDPELPCTIFLSLPVGEPHAVLRTAESVLHEAMHLQLTLIEAQAPLVRSSSSTLYSPWQQRDRPVSGVLHGVYVFAVIDAFMAERLAHGDLAPNDAAFAAKRREEIAEELEAAAGIMEHEDLTPFGKQFVAGLLSARLRRQAPGRASGGR